MAPGNNESGGKRRRAKARKGNRWLRTILVECGDAAGRTRNTALYRRMLVRGGRKHAAFVVGRRILNIAYHLLAERTTYRELGATYFEQRRVEQVKRRCLDRTERSSGRGHRTGRLAACSADVVRVSARRGITRHRDERLQIQVPAARSARHIVYRYAQASQLQGGDFEGRATMEAKVADDMLECMAVAYTGKRAGREYAEQFKNQSVVVVRFKPQRVISWDYSKD
jgi:hypothetical protein